MVPLGVGINGAAPANALDPIQQGWLGKGGGAKLRPIRPLAAGDDVVDGGKSEALMVEVAVLHGRLPMVMALIRPPVSSALGAPVKAQPKPQAHRLGLTEKPGSMRP